MLRQRYEWQQGHRRKDQGRRGARTSIILWPSDIGCDDFPVLHARSILPLLLYEIFGVAVW